MALSQQDLFVNLLLPNRKGFYLDIGAGNGEGMPCASNTKWLSDLGWEGILLEFDINFCKEAAVLRHDCSIIQGNAYEVNYREIFEKLQAPKIIDYISLDIDPPSLTCNVDILSRLPLDTYDFKILTIEHDFYNKAVGPIQKPAMMKYMADKKYKLIAEDVALSYSSTKYLEDWYINPEFYDEFNIVDIEKLYYYRMNPNDIIMDLVNKRKKI